MPPSDSRRPSPMGRTQRRRATAAAAGTARVGSQAPTATAALVAGGSARRAHRTRSQLWSALWRPGRGQLIAAFILFVVGLGSAVQVRISRADDTYTTARREDLVQLLDGLGAESNRLESEISERERTRTSLQSGVDTSRVARQEAQKRVEVLSVLAGTAPAVGPGIRIRITDPKHKVGADVLLDAVEEMRDAGAEVIEVNDTVRVVASTWFAADGRGLLIDGHPVRAPVTLEVIGEPHSLEEAARFRGGLASEITGPLIGGRVEIEQLDRVVIDSLHVGQENKYAQPASPPPTPR